MSLATGQGVPDSIPVTSLGFFFSEEQFHGSIY